MAQLSYYCRRLLKASSTSRRAPIIRLISHQPLRLATIPWGWGASVILISRPLHNRGRRVVYIGVTSTTDANWVGSNFLLRMLQFRYISSDMTSTRLVHEWVYQYFIHINGSPPPPRDSDTAAIRLYNTYPRYINAYTTLPVLHTAFYFHFQGYEVIGFPYNSLSYLYISASSFSLLRLVRC